MEKCCVAIGVFDGVHLGHRKLLEALNRAAGRHEACPVAVTFDPHPRALFRPDDAPPLLLPLAWRKQYLTQYGARRVEVIGFSPEFAGQSPAEFLDLLLGRNGGARVAAIVVGTDWRFGKEGSGDTAWLAGEAARRGVEFVGVPAIELDGERISSSAIRHAASAGELARARAMLGRNYALYGQVEAGFQAAGGELGHPTANLALTAGVMPPDGVYAGRALGRAAAVNIGTAPTYGHLNCHRRRVEVHILDFHDDLYGREIEVELLEFLREERIFPGPAELRRQIEQDVARIRRRAAMEE